MSIITKNSIYKIFFITVLSFVIILESKANDREIELNQLFKELKTDNTSISYKVEQKIWEIWSTHPTNKKLTSILAKGSSLVKNNQLNKAIEVFSEVINQDPNWAEAWNKRATVFYMIGEYQKSQKDIDKVLKLEKRHFGALSGQGLVQIKLENFEKALRSYEQVEQIYPSMISPKIMIPQIKEMIKNQSV